MYKLVDSITKAPPRELLPVAHTVSVQIRPRRSRLRLLSSAAFTLFILLVCIASLALFSVSRTQRIFTIISGSMEPRIPTGSIVSIAPVNADKLHVGDVIAFHASQGVITHRIIERLNTEDGLFFTTKGDANPIPDPTPVPIDEVIGRQTLLLPYAGYAIVWLRTIPGFAIGVLLPATLIILHELRLAFAAWRTIAKPRVNFRLASAFGGAMTLLMLLSVPFAHALLITNSVGALNNTFSTAAVFPTPTPTPTPTATPTPTPTAVPTPTPSVCGTNVDINQGNTNTGPGSTNENSAIVTTNCNQTQTNSSTVTNTATITANTGGNQQTGTTDSGNVTSGNIHFNLNIQNNVH